MTLPTSGALSIGDVAAELGIGLPLELGDSRVRALAGVASGAISLSDLYGKSASGTGGGGTGGGGTGTSTDFTASLADASDTAQGNYTASSGYNAPVNLYMDVAGGQAPYSFAWSKLSGSGTITNVNAASTTHVFRVARFDESGEVKDALVQCSVTDAAGRVLVRSATVTLTLT